MSGNSFGDVRAMCLQTVRELRTGQMDVSRGMAIAANIKVLNDNVHAEIAATKLAIATQNETLKLGEVMRMGTLTIAPQLPPPQ